MSGSRDVPERPDLGFLRRRRHATAGTGQAPPALSLLDLAPTVPQQPTMPAAPAGDPRPPHRPPEPPPATPDLGWLRRRPPVRRVAPAAPARPPVAPAPAAARPAPTRPASTRPAAAAAPAPAPAVAGAAASVAGDTPLRGLLTLRSSRPSVTIPGSQSTSGPLRLHLTWSTLPTDQRSLQAGLRRSTDVHLGVLWETNDGHQGVVQSLGDSFLAPGWGSTLLRLGPRSETEGETV
ncbi:MAG TPA: hypothetical protein VFR07_19150, partial [Mycobacteriales bacterium]|nr:hypothetical protein [Mycobacteriales bacterium]